MNNYKIQMRVDNWPKIFEYQQLKTMKQEKTHGFHLE